MFNSINVSALLDPSQELSLDDLDLVLGGGSNAVSATGAGDDQQQQSHPYDGRSHSSQENNSQANALNLSGSPVTGNINLNGSATGLLNQAGQALNHMVQTVDRIVEQGANTVTHLVDPIYTAIGQEGGDIIHAIGDRIEGAIRGGDAGTAH